MSVNELKLEGIWERMRDERDSIARCIARDLVVGCPPSKLDVWRAMYFKAWHDERLAFALRMAYADAQRRAWLASHRYTLNDEPVDILDFLDANAEGLDADEQAAIVRLQIGQEFAIGGGAAPLSVLRRIA
jgi:hypothetical protein